MAPMLGIFFYGFERYPSFKNDKNLAANYYPSKQLLTFIEWQNLIDYYVATSPDTLPEKNSRQSIKKEVSLFNVIAPSFYYENPSTSYVHINENNSGNALIACDAIKQNIYFFNGKLDVIDSIHNSQGPVVDIDFGKNEALACNIGFMNPTNNKLGKGQLITFRNGQTSLDTLPLFDMLQRPVQITSSDLNKDGKKDYLVCEFGFLTGSLSWLQNLGNNQYKKNILRPYPGVIKAYIDDHNKDGFPDIWALFTQGEEGIFLFTNKGNGSFQQKEVLRFPPVYGSSYFEFADMNKDGHPDVVYTCGDNSDHSPVLKPYHGVYIFINDGKYNFKQQYFFPVNGCYKAIARDFDKDGDVDIATISFFADYSRKPEEGFVYLENTGNLQFTPFSLPETQQGRWLTMDAGDINKDGDIDLVLGNFSVAPTIIKSSSNWTKGPPFIILENVGKKKL